MYLLRHTWIAEYNYSTIMADDDDLEKRRNSSKLIDLRYLNEFKTSTILRRAVWKIKFCLSTQRRYAITDLMA